MTEFEIAALSTFAWLNGILLGYIIWAPTTEFKRGLINGMTFKFIRDRLRRV